MSARGSRVRQVRAKSPFEAGGEPFFRKDRRRAVQIIDNLVEREVNSVIDLEFQPEQTLQLSFESLIPAQNQRWRRA